jgi:ElaB/YqjD/DUF883 family membrane-anchored ribosome-binding protein
MKLKERGDHFKAKPNAIPTLPTMEEFLNISSLHKLDHDETLRMIQHLTEALIQIDKNLAAKLQYLEDNMQNISEKTGVELTKVKSEAADALQRTNHMIELLTESKEKDKQWRRIFGEKSPYVV